MLTFRAHLIELRVGEDESLDFRQANFATESVNASLGLPITLRSAAAFEPTCKQPGPVTTFSSCWRRLLLLSCIPTLSVALYALPVSAAEDDTQPAVPASSNYQLGPEDSLLVHVKDEPEIPDGPYQIDLDGNLVIPEIGTIHAAGLSVRLLSAVITDHCRTLMTRPVVAISVAEYRSQRVMVLGAVGTPGVQQIRGRKTLFEAISEAGGLKQNAGGTIEISRLVQEGSLPLAKSQLDSSGRFETAAIDIDSLMRAQSPQANIALRPNDVVTVPKAELIYVLGAVRKPGGFELAEKQTMSVLQALALAEGADRTASVKHARILRSAEGPGPRTEVPLDISKLLAGKQHDVMLRPNDILVVPNSAAKSASYRALEAVVSTGVGVAIYHP